MSIRRAILPALVLLAIQPAGPASAQTLTPETVRAVMEAWRIEIRESGLTPAERDREERDAEARRSAEERRAAEREKCQEEALTPAAMMDVGQKMQQRMAQLAQAGDPDAGTKAAAESRIAMDAIIEKKCGPTPSATTDRVALGRVRERILTYLKVRREKGAAAAAEAINATPEEVAVIEQNRAALTELASIELKGGAGKL
jgi:hypothetical protein